MGARENPADCSQPCAEAAQPPAFAWASSPELAVMMKHEVWSARQSFLRVIKY